MSHPPPPNFVHYGIFSIIAHSVAIIHYNTVLSSYPKHHPLYDDFSRLWSILCLGKLIILYVYKIFPWQKKWIEISLLLFTLCSDVSIITLLEISTFVWPSQRYLFACSISVTIAQIGTWLNASCFRRCSRK